MKRQLVCYEFFKLQWIFQQFYIWAKCSDVLLGNDYYSTHGILLYPYCVYKIYIQNGLCSTVRHCTPLWCNTTIIIPVQGQASEIESSEGHLFDQPYHKLRRQVCSFHQDSHLKQGSWKLLIILLRCTTKMPWDGWYLASYINYGHYVSLWD